MSLSNDYWIDPRSEWNVRTTGLIVYKYHMKFYKNYDAFYVNPHPHPPANCDEHAQHYLKNHPNLPNYPI